MRLVELALGRLTDRRSMRSGISTGSRSCTHPSCRWSVGKARGVENRDFIREDRHSERCWVTIAVFNSLYPEIAEATDLGATLRSNIRESLPLENWEGTPLEALLRAAGIILGTPAVIGLAGAG